MARVICNIGFLCHDLTANVGGLCSLRAAVGILEAFLACVRVLRPDLFLFSVSKGFVPEPPTSVRLLGAFFSGSWSAFRGPFTILTRRERRDNPWPIIFSIRSEACGD